MSILDATYRTVTCNGPNCTKTTTFEQSQDGAGVRAALEEHPWLKTTRIVQQIAGGRNYTYCSDECEIAGAGAGAHNPEEPKKIIAAPGNAGLAAIQQAAANAKAAEEATKALKSGGPVTLQGS